MLRSIHFGNKQAGNCGDERGMGDKGKVIARSVLTFPPPLLAQARPEVWMVWQREARRRAGLRDPASGPWALASMD